MSVPSTEKCSRLTKPAAFACPTFRTKELPGHVVRDETIAILREHRRIEARLLHVHVEEPTKQKVVVALLAELPLAPHRVERDQKHRLQQTLRRESTVGRPTSTSRRTPATAPCASACSHAAAASAPHAR